MIQNEENEYQWAEEERKWRDSLPRFTDTLLQEVFHDGIFDLDDKVAELKELASTLLETITRTGKPYFNKTDDNSLFMLQWIKSWYISDLVKIEVNIQFIERLQRKLTTRHKKTSVALTDKDIEIARSIPIINLATTCVQKLRSQGKNYSGCCPFHHDKNPSLTFYTDTNRFHCFGCQASGDAIDFARKVLGTDFKTTIHYLNTL